VGSLAGRRCPSQLAHVDRRARLHSGCAWRHADRAPPRTSSSTLRASRRRSEGNPGGQPLVPHEPVVRRAAGEAHRRDRQRRRGLAVGSAVARAPRRIVEVARLRRPARAPGPDVARVRARSPWPRRVVVDARTVPTVGLRLRRDLPDRGRDRGAHGGRRPLGRSSTSRRAMSASSMLPPASGTP
jgi:hypothetical protein